MRDGGRADIRHLADVCAPVQRETLPSMKIVVSLGSTEPPVGEIVLIGDDQAPDDDASADRVEFAGWLGLLRALESVLGTRYEQAD